MSRKWGTMRATTVPTPRTNTGTLTSRSADRPTSSRRANTTPPIMVKGAASSSVQVMSTSIWTCWTSLVIRVMSDGEPKWVTSRLENPVTWWNRLRRTSRPNPIEAFAPKYTAPTARATWATVTTSITAPMRRM